MIDGVIVQELQRITDERGSVMHMLRHDSHLFHNFGEIYFSIVNPGYIKAWKKHLKMTQHFAVPIGNIKLVIYDDRENSVTYKNIMVLAIGQDNYCLVKIPPLVWYGFTGVSASASLIANCTDIPHDPQETIRLSIYDKIIPYDWHKDE